MNTLSGVAINHSVIPANRQLQLETPETRHQATTAELPEVAVPATRPAVKVDLSVEGLQASASADKPKDSPAAQQAKEVAKIRERMKELQQKLQEQQAQLQAIQGDSSLTPEEKTQRSSAIIQQIAGLNAEFASATAQLMEALRGKPKLPGADGVQAVPYVKHEMEKSPPSPV
ncbi:hypothetical protein ACIPL1_25830 [Pseudomonas sp. NPDC090202]|uniref:hypothetical protein n=1 Tax=unclassified Pseudomonas TaxID=196821 RepID=UPI00382B8BF9